MASCASCGARNPDSFRFCGSCGTPLSGAACASCGFANPPENRFCGQCGTALGGSALGAGAPAAPAAVDERKLATVLFADVVGFTSLAERTDPEAVARTVDAAFRRLAEIVAEHGGTVDKYMGDSLMALFGVPQAHDDDAERAVAAGLAMREVGGDLAFSIGINTGEVMVTSFAGDEAPTVVGDAVNVAARLEKTAGPGEVLVGPLTARLAGDRVVLRERDPVMLKGKREAVPVCEAVALRAPSDAPEVTARPPLVGRSDELAFLLGQWRRVVRTGRPAVVLVSGDAGVGTTRLVEELAADLADDARAVWASYPAYGSMGGPRVAADIAAALGPTGDTEVDTRVRALSGEHVPALKEIDPGGMYQEMVWAFVRLLQMKAAEEPLLVVIDDVHRAGERSLGVITDLVGRVDDMPLLLLLVGRPQPSEWLTRFPTASTLHLDPLGRDDAVALAEALAGGRLADDAAEFLTDRSGGNPLFVRELVAIADERGQLSTEDGEIRLTGAQAVPPTLRTILAARLDALAPEEKLAVQHLAVLAEPATSSRVAALGLDDAGAVLERLVASGFVRRHGPEHRFDVADPMFAEIAYEALPHNARVERHRLAAEGADDAEERARHLSRAARYAPDDPDLAAEAAAALATAGRELRDAFRHEDAIRLLEHAIELGDDSPETLLVLAEALSVVGRNEKVAEVLERLPADLDDPALEAQRVHLWGSIKVFLDPPGAVPLLEEAARRWHELGNLEKEAWAHANAGPALFAQSRLEEAAAALERSVPLFQKAGDRGGVLAAHSFLAIMRPNDPRVEGWLEDGLRYAEGIGDRARQVGALVSLTWHHYLRARLGGDDEITVASAHAARMAALCQEVGSVEFYVTATAIRANLLRLAGRLEAARDLMQGLDHDAAAGERATCLVHAVDFDLQLALSAGSEALPPEVPPSPDPVVAVAVFIEFEALVLAGRTDEANVYYDGDATTRPRLQAIDAVLPGLTIALGRILIGEFDGVEQALELAIETAEDIRAEPAGAAARALLAEVLVHTGGDRERAAVLLDEARAEPVGGVAGALVRRAAAVLGGGGMARDLGPELARLGAPGLALESG